MINLTIDGKTIEVTEGTTVLRAAEQAGVFIPTLCDHPELTPYGGCRLCLVEVEGFRTLQPSCTLPATNNMVVHTDTPKIHTARKFVLSLIFSERNHFCPYCQVSGGDCELQNNAYQEEMTHWPIQPNWQGYEVDASHPYIVIDHNRCILCRRCVRACGELVGNYTLGFAERGAASILVADLGVPLGESTCISCGMCVQVCPTGAIIDRSSAYQGLDKKVEKQNTICQGCSVGCGITVVRRDNRLLRIEGNWEATVNHGLTCEIGRYHPLYEERTRILSPMLRKEGELTPVTWDEALTEIANRARLFGATPLASSRLSVETLHALNQVFGTPVQILEESPTATTEGLTEGELECLDQADCILVVGTDLAENHQVAGFLVKRAFQSGVPVIIVDNELNALDGVSTQALKSTNLTAVLEALEAALVKLGLNKSVVDAKPWEVLGTVNAKTGLDVEEILAAAQIIGDAKNIAIIYGERVTSANANGLKELANLALAAGAMSNERSSVIGVKGQANSLAAALLGFKPASSLVGGCYVALGDAVYPEDLVQKLKGLPFLVVQASYASALTDQADIVLPSAIWAEESGHFINLEGKVQQTSLVLQAPPEVKSNMEIVSALAEKMGVELSPDWQTPIHAGLSPVALHS